MLFRQAHFTDSPDCILFPKIKIVFLQTVSVCLLAQSLFLKTTKAISRNILEEVEHGIRMHHSLWSWNPQFKCGFLPSLNAAVHEWHTQIQAAGVHQLLRRWF